MAVEVYSYTDASAPTMNGTADSIITLLDAILVNGYGSKAAAGWTKAYTGTNKAAYRMAATLGARGYYLRVVDGGDTNRSFQAQGYATMTTVDAGTSKMPMAGQINGTWDYQYLVKSQTSDATARPWYAVADNKGIYLFWDTGGTSTFTTTYFQYLYFGQCSTLAPGDPGTVFMMGTPNTAVTTYSSSVLGSLAYMYGTPTTLPRHVISESFAGMGPSVPCAKVFRGWSGGHDTALGESTGLTIPDPVTGKVNLAQLHIWETGAASNKGIIRGPIPFLFALDHVLTGYNASFCAANLLSTFAGSGTLAGKNFMIVPAPVSSTMYYMAVQISGDR